MARRRKSSPLEDLIDVLALLPWWACVGLAVVWYVILHWLARPASASIPMSAGWAAACLLTWGDGMRLLSYELPFLVRKPVRQLSLGERMKVEIVGSLLHLPLVLFLLWLLAYTLEYHPPILP